MSEALLLVDLQNDFCPGGRLAVQDGDQVIAVANQWMQKFEIVVATQDWHPENHKSFANNHAHKQPGEVIELHDYVQILWPAHCVQNTHGAELHSLLNVNSITKIIHKGTDAEIDSYSAFFDNKHLRQTELDSFLKQHNISKIYVLGLATDYCVKYTCLDAIHLGYEVTLILSGCRGVNLNENDSKQAVAELINLGVQIEN